MFVQIFFRGIPLKTMISMSYPSEKESASITRRLQNIEEFIDFSLAPPVPPPPVPPPPPTAAEIKQRLREERKAKKDPKRKEKKLKKLQKKKEKNQKHHQQPPYSKGGKREHHQQEQEHGGYDSSNQDSKYLPNDEDFPDIRKFNEVSPTKSRGESLYAAALAAVRGNGDSQRHRKESDSENEDSEQESDEEEEGEEDYSQGSSVSDLETDDEELNPTANLEVGTAEAPLPSLASNKMTSANLLDDDLDEADDVIVFQPAFAQQQQQPSPIGRPMTSSPSKSSPIAPHQQSRTQQQQVEVMEGGGNAGIDLESLAYLQALHKKNTEQGWLSHHTSGQPILPVEFHDKPRGSQHPFQLEQASGHDYWSPHENSEMGLLNGYEYSGDHAKHSFFMDTPSQQVPEDRLAKDYSWSPRSFSSYDKFSAPAAADVPPPPGFMELSAMNPPHSDDYQMNSTAASFLPTSLRQSSTAPAPPQAQPSSSRLSMFYGSDPEQRSWHHTSPPGGYQARQNGT
jgi:hypothetical protein